MSHAEVVLFVDTDLGTIIRVDILTSPSIKAMGDGITVLPIAGLGARGDTWTEARAKCAANLAHCAWCMGSVGTPLRDAVDRVASGLDDGEVKS